MKTSDTLKLVTAIMESLLAVPIFGFLLIISTFWIILGVMLILHIITLVFSIRENKSYYGSISGIFASVLGIIPFLGWTLHLITAVLLWVSFSQDLENNTNK